MLSEYDVVTLRRDIPEAGLIAGQVGTVVMVYNEPTTGYEVEFADSDGSTLALLTLKEHDIEQKI